MISFYGSKGRIAKKYPSPKHFTLIEPFAGFAKYSYLHWETPNVILIEKDEKIFGIWDYLINHATPTMILSLPDVDGYKIKLEDVEGFSQLSNPEKWMIGFCVNNGSAQPKNVSASTGNFNSWKRDKIRIANDLHKVKHWNVVHGDYADAPDITATWFVDSPYIDKGTWYVHGSDAIDYSHLGLWCKSRMGQIIVCENYGADWLPFEPLVEIPFSHYKTEEDRRKKTVEAIWYNER